MKYFGLASLLVLPAFSAVTSLPTAPAGFQWQLVTSGQTDSDVVDVSGVENNLEAALGLNGTAPVPFTVNGSGSDTADLTAFGSPEPGSYSVGDTVDLVTANTFAATLSVNNTAAVSNPATAFLLVESKLSGVQITSSLGATTPASDNSVTGGTDPFIIVSPNAEANVTSSGSFSQVEGETITFTFAGADELAVSTFGTAPPSQYLVNSTVNASLRRDTTYDTYELVAIPEPSSLSLVALAALGVIRRRRA